MDVSICISQGESPVSTDGALIDGSDLVSMTYFAVAVESPVELQG